MAKRKPTKAAANLASHARAGEQAIRPAEHAPKFDLVIAARLSRELGVSPVTLWRWRRSPGFPPSTPINRRVYFSRSAISDWLDRQRQAGGASLPHRVSA